MLISFIRVIGGGYFFSLLYIFVLGSLIATAEQDNDFLPGILVIHPVAGAIVDTHFRDALPGGLYIAGVSFPQPLDPDGDSMLGLGISQLFEPFFVDTRFAYPHTMNVDHNLHSVKRIRLFLIGIFRFFLPGAASLGDFPDLVNTGRVIKGLFSYRAYSGSKKSLHNGRGPYTQNLGYLCDGQSFHGLNFAYFFKKINSFNQQVIDKPVIYNYDVYMFQVMGDKGMAKALLLGPVEMAAVETRVANMGKELYQLLEDYPSLQPPGWTYVAAIMFLHQQIYDEAIKLKKAIVLKEKEAVA
jgi:hypothetical protein